MIPASLPSLRVSPREETNDRLPSAIQTWPTAANSPARAFFTDTACDTTVESLSPIRNDNKEKNDEGLDFKKATKAEIRAELAAYKVARRVDDLHRR